MKLGVNKMTKEHQDGNILKNLKEKVEAVTYAPEKSAGNTWITMKGVRYAIWLDEDVEIYPGNIVEHSPYVKKEPGQTALICTKIIKIQ